MKNLSYFALCGIMSAWPFLSGAMPSGNRRAAEGGIIRKIVEVKGADEELELFLKLPACKAKGVLCLCLLSFGDKTVEERLKSPESDKRISSLLRYAAKHDFAVLAWTVVRAWDSRRNWNELDRGAARRFDEKFDAMAKAWDRALSNLALRYDLPEDGYLIWGLSAGGQFAMRLALRLPERFACVQAQVPSSFDEPVKKGATVLWCLTTGENETGYSRSIEFVKAARRLGYPIVYKAYPGVGHLSTSSAVRLGSACFEYALKRKATLKSDFREAGYVADIVNQKIFPVEEIANIPEEFRTPIPSALKKFWEAE